MQAEKTRLANRYLTCTHTASGHSAGVLCVFATENLLFSGSQDRTVKIWDLKSGQEVLTLDKHFSYVRCVRYCSRNRLIFTASQSLIKIWDHRNFRGKCIKTFGPPHSGSHSGADTVVQDLLLSSSSNTLFSAAGNVVNIWDFRKFANQGRLVGHNGAVCALASNQELVMTGSRDRLIKLYEADSVQAPPEGSPQSSSSTPSHYPSVTLYPPHYDAVSSFAIHNSHLFSSCGCSFKQWDTEEKQLKVTVDGAHPQGTTITSLGVLASPLSPLLVSGCKGGLLKLWNPDSCANIGEVPAHKNPINSIATNDTCIFTASSDKTIRIWRSSPQDV
jgi:kinesin family protein 4/21/27